MSIINQALKKAQREQLLHATPHQPYASQRPPLRPYPAWWFIGVACIVVLGAGTMRYIWLLPPTQPTEERQSPRLARQALAPALPQPTLPLPAAPVPMPTPPVDTASPALAPVSTPPTTSTVVRPTPEPVRPTLAATPRNSAATSARRSLQSELPPLPTPQVVASAAPLTPAPAPIRSRAQALFQRATEFQERDQHLRAITLLQEAVALDPTFKEAYNKLGNLHYKQQAYRQALNSFQKVLAIDPDDVKAHNNLGSTYLRLDMDGQARDVLHKAIAIDQTYGLAYYNLACAYARIGDSTTTVQYLKHAITIEPRARDWAQTDDDFRRVRNTTELRQLLGPASW